METWKKKLCRIHKCLHQHAKCTCPPPFQLYTFPPEKSQLERRSEWEKATQRAMEVMDDKGNFKTVNWKAVKNSRLCSTHFVGGEKTIPTLNLGKAGKYHRPQNPRKPPMDRSKVIPTSSTISTSTTSTSTVTNLSRTSAACEDVEHSYACSCHCHICVCPCASKKVKDAEFCKVASDQAVSTYTAKLRKSTLKYLKTDAKVKTYTGLKSKVQFNDLLKHISGKAIGMRYWAGVKNTKPVTRNFKQTPKKSGPMRKLSLREELLLTLMKLRLAPINEMLGDIFGVSETTVSHVFNTWVKMLKEELLPLIYWPEKEAIKSDAPKSLPPKYRNVRCTIDCTEVFIQKPRNLELQSMTWSDYKKVGIYHIDHFNA